MFIQPPIPKYFMFFTYWTCAYFHILIVSLSLHWNLYLHLISLMPILIPVSANLKITFQALKFPLISPFLEKEIFPVPSLCLREDMFTEILYHLSKLSISVLVTLSNSNSSRIKDAIFMFETGVSFWGLRLCTEHPELPLLWGGQGSIPRAPGHLKGAAAAPWITQDSLEN